MKQITILLPLMLSACASARTIYWDQGAGTGVIRTGSLTNEQANGNIADSVRFTQDRWVNLFTTYNAEPTNHPDYIFRVFADAGGRPGDLLFDSTAGTDSTPVLVGQDSDGVSIYQHDLVLGNQHYTFLANTTYWVGAPTNVVSGTATTIRTPYDGVCAEMQGTSFVRLLTNNDFQGGDLMFRLGAVPEPSEFVSLGLGAILFAVGKRRKR